MAGRYAGVPRYVEKGEKIALLEAPGPALDLRPAHGYSSVAFVGDMFMQERLGRQCQVDYCTVHDSNAADACNAAAVV